MPFLGVLSSIPTEWYDKPAKKEGRYLVTVYVKNYGPLEDRRFDKIGDAIKYADLFRNDREMKVWQCDSLLYFKAMDEDSYGLPPEEQP